MTFIDSPTDIAVTLAFFVVAVVVYKLIERYQPGAGQVPEELSMALRWLRDDAEDGIVLAWWDYAAPLRDHTHSHPFVAGPSRDLEDTIDNPGNVSSWGDPETVGRVAAFLLADGPDTALSVIDPTEFDYVLVARSDLLKPTAIRQAAPPGTVAEPPKVFLRTLVAGDVDWPIAYQNQEVIIYQSPA